MNTAIVNIKTSQETKKKAQAIANELGFSLSSLVNAYLRDLVRNKRVFFALSEEPSDYLIQELKKSDEDIKKGRVSPVFDNAEDAFKWLNNPKKKYAGKILKKVQQRVQ